ncbi:TetR/AcrR family transcriptional regulator [Streptomyces adelaidensis]|uniref:TetR/AcrR family transcriptional regulator n=1 Tax=Streptomyces adelaidensis TaxID=2796465 RepID=UPI001908A676|nr:TetR/AcrR family transcriptional regulator [Streptomyces adelaidensis]
MTDDEATPQQRAAETKRRRTREWIITSTLDLYGELDKGDFTREQIAEAAGVGLTTLSNHFRLKWDVLRVAHERLLAPIVEPLREGRLSGTYKPDDGVVELLRYLYAVAKMCHQHRALTVAMIRAYYETAPDQRPELYNKFGTMGSFPEKNLGWYIGNGFSPIFTSPPFGGSYMLLASDRPRSHADVETAYYHAQALLTQLYHEPSEDAPILVTRVVSREMLSVLMPDIDMKTTEQKLTGVQSTVNAWFEDRKRREEMY